MKTKTVISSLLVTASVLTALSFTACQNTTTSSQSQAATSQSESVSEASSASTESSDSTFSRTLSIARNKVNVSDKFLDSVIELLSDKEIKACEVIDLSSIEETEADEGYEKLYIMLASCYTDKNADFATRKITSLSKTVVNLSYDEELIKAQVSSEN